MRPALFDQVDEEAKRVTENVELRGEFEEKRASRLLQTLDAVCRRRTVPPGLGIQYIANSPRDPDLTMRLAMLHAKGRYAFEFVTGDA